MTKQLLLGDSLTGAYDEGLFTDAVLFEFAKTFDLVPNIIHFAKHRSICIGKYFFIGLDPFSQTDLLNVETKLIYLYIVLIFVAFPREKFHGHYFSLEK